MAVVFHHHDLLIRTDLVQLFPMDQATFPYGIWGSTERNEGVSLGSGHELTDHFLDFLIGACLHHIESCLKSGEGCKVLMRVHKRRSQCTISKFHQFRGPILLRKIISHVNDRTLIFNQVVKHFILSVYGKDRSFITLHRSSSSF